MRKRDDFDDPDVESFKVSDTDPFQVCPYGQPREIGYFSFDNERTLLLNSRQELKYYHAPSMPCSLKEGFPDKFVQRANVNEHLDALLRCLSFINQQKKDDKLKPHFVTWRGIMTKLMTCPYETSNSFELRLTRYQGVIYIEENDLRKSQFDGNFEFTYYGYKFESLATISQLPQGVQPEEDDIVNTNAQFCSVFKTRLGPHQLILGGEVDCLYNAPQPGRPIQEAYCELKTNRLLQSKGQTRSFYRHKLLKVWAQSYLAGVPRVLIGYRDDNGILHSVKEYKTNEFPRLARPQKLWDPQRCLAFAKSVLDWLAQHITIDDKTFTYTLRFNHTDKVLYLLKPVQQHGFISQDYSL